MSTTVTDKLSVTSAVDHAARTYGEFRVATIGRAVLRTSHRWYATVITSAATTSSTPAAMTGNGWDDVTPISCQVDQNQINVKLK